MKILPLFIMLVIASLGFTAYAFAAPYLDWQYDYTGTEANTIALWKFDDSTKPGLATTGAGLDFTVSNIPSSIVEDGGKFGGGIVMPDSPADARIYHTNGNNASMAAFNGSAMSVELWYKTPDSLDGLSGYFVSRGGSTDYRFDLSLKSNFTISLAVGNGSATAILLSDEAVVLSTDTWYHIAATYENIDGDGVMKLYLNGILIGSQTVDGFGDLNGDPGTGTRRGWNLGNRSVSAYDSLPGTYDNFRISSVAYEYAIPEPTIATLLLIASGALFIRRKRCA